MSLPTGTRLGHYEVRTQLGAGGMGEVYLAHDRRLDRVVALKILPSEVARAEAPMRRFVQEARAASALNHPNILTVFEFGQEGGTHFIATEFVDGVTLRERLARGPLPLAEALEIGVQIAGALAAAHQSGIVHRDVKPENVMLRRDGYVKVLDFGLAKLAERHTSAGDPDAATMMHNVTEPGTVMDTVRYMSPEQARGLAVDARTDVWSLGCVLFEMVTGRTPFEGPTQSHVIVSILEKEAPPVASFAPSAPPELARIAAKALAKDPDDRYQTVKDLQIDLRQLKHRLEFEAELERSVQPNQPTLRMSSARAAAQSQPPAAPTEPIAPAHSTQDTGFPARAVGTRRRLRLALTAAALLALCGGALTLYKLLSPGAPARFHTINLTRLTATGKATDAAVSPDGKYVVHVVTEGGRQSLWIRHVATTSNVQIVQPSEARYRGLTFSPDGNFIYYVVRDQASPSGVLYQVPVLGGAPKRLLAGVDRPVTFGPGGKQFAFVRGNPSAQGAKALMIANADGTETRQIAAPGLTGDFWSPAWSPGGEVIACAAVDTEGGLHVNVVGVRLSDGAVTRISDEKWFDVGRMVWLADGSGLLITATTQGSGFSNQIWHLPYPSGTARRVTNDLNNYSGLGLTADSSTLVAVQAEQRAGIWLVDAGGGPGEPRQLSNGSSAYEGVYGLDWLPDGRLVYESTASGDEDIWIADADGGNQRQLTAKAGINLFPRVTPDGRHIVFVSTRAGGNTNLWRMSIDGTEPKQLSGGSIDNFPDCTPDSRAVVYMSNVGGRRTLWRVSIDGGPAVQLTQAPSWWPAVSPADGTIACYYQGEGADARPRLAVLPPDGGAPVKIFDGPPASLSALPNPLRWSPDGRAITYVETRGGVSNVWRQPLAGGPPAQVTNFKSDRIYSFDWSPDGRQLACSRGTEISDVVLIRDAGQVR